MAGNIFSQIIPLMAAMALPFPVIKATRLLLAGKPVAHSILFISTWGIICFLVLSTSIILATLKIALFQVKNGLLLSLIIYILLKNQLPLGQSLIASAMISISGMICVSMPLIVYFWAGSQRDTILEELKIWLIRNNSTLVVFIYLFIGISTLSSGIGELLPELLEIIYQRLSS